MAEYNQPFTIAPNEIAVLPPAPPGRPVVVYAINNSPTPTELIVFSPGSGPTFIQMGPGENKRAEVFVFGPQEIEFINADREGDSPITVIAQTY